MVIEVKEIENFQIKILNFIKNLVNFLIQARYFISIDLKYNS